MLGRDGRFCRLRGDPRPRVLIIDMTLHITQIRFTMCSTSKWNIADKAIILGHIYREISQFFRLDDEDMDPLVVETLRWWRHVRPHAVCGVICLTEGTEEEDGETPMFEPSGDLLEFKAQTSYMSQAASLSSGAAQQSWQAVYGPFKLVALIRLVWTADYFPICIDDDQDEVPRAAQGGRPRAASCSQITVASGGDTVLSAGIAFPGAFRHDARCRIFSVVGQAKTPSLRVLLLMPEMLSRNSFAALLDSTFQTRPFALMVDEVLLRYTWGVNSARTTCSLATLVTASHLDRFWSHSQLPSKRDQRPTPLAPLRPTLSGLRAQPNPLRPAILSALRDALYSAPFPDSKQS
ncbi:hypothetical protein EV121DRAFT_274835 [Schizophyllum commune]